MDNLDSSHCLDISPTNSVILNSVEGNKHSSRKPFQTSDYDTEYYNPSSLSVTFSSEWSPPSSPTSPSILLHLLSSNSNNNQSFVKDSLCLSPLDVISGANRDQPLARVEFTPPRKTTALE